MRGTPTWGLAGVSRSLGCDAPPHPLHLLDRRGLVHAKEEPVLKVRLGSRPLRGASVGRPRPPTRSVVYAAFWDVCCILRHPW